MTGWQHQARVTYGAAGTTPPAGRPTLSGALKASESDLQWFSSAYTLALAAMMLPAGLLGDRYGRKKVMLLSLALFAAGSLACVYSKTSGQFIAARILLGFAGAGLIVMAISALTVIYPSPPVVGQQPAAEYRPYRVLPVVRGLLVGLMPAAPIAKAIGAKLTAARWLPGDRHRPGGSALLRRRHRARASSRRGWR